MPISSDVDVVPFRSEKDSYSLFPLDGMLIQWHFLKNQSNALCKFMRMKNSWHLLGLNPGPPWKQFANDRSTSEIDLYINLDVKYQFFS